jgi:hypothetical protein
VDGVGVGLMPCIGEDGNRWRTRWSCGDVGDRGGRGVTVFQIAWTSREYLSVKSLIFLGKHNGTVLVCIITLDR